LNLMAGLAVYGAGVLWFVLSRNLLGAGIKIAIYRYFGRELQEPGA
jgi:hypothetical protein